MARYQGRPRVISLIEGPRFLRMECLAAFLTFSKHPPNRAPTGLLVGSIAICYLISDHEANTVYNGMECTLLDRGSYNVSSCGGVLRLLP
jgi:hypothetical protein